MPRRSSGLFRPDTRYQLYQRRLAVPSAVAVARSNTFEGGADGVAITAGNSGGASGDAFTGTTTAAGASVAFTTTRAAHGGAAMRVVGPTSAGQSRVEWAFTATPVTTGYAYIYAWFPALPSGDAVILQLRDPSLNPGAALRVKANGHLQVEHNAAAGTEGTVPVPTGTWVRLELAAVASATAGSVTVRWFLGDSTSPGDSFTQSTIDTGGSFGRLDAGFDFVPAGMPTVDFDDPALSSVAMPALPIGGFNHTATVTDPVGLADSISQTSGGGGGTVSPVGAATDFWKMETSTTAGGAGTNPWVAVDRASNTNIVLQNGDVLWSVACWNASEAPNIAVPAGWTVPTGWPFVQGALVGLVVAYRVVTDTITEPTTYTWQPKATDGTTNQAARGSVGIRVYRGADATTPMDATPVRSQGVQGGATAVLTAITTATANAFVLSGIGIEASTATTTLTHPAGTTKTWDLVGRRQSMAEEGAQAAAGGSGTVAWSWGASTLNWVGYQAAIRPGAAGGTSFSQTVTDTIGTADPASQALAAAQTATDPVGVGDPVTRVKDTVQAVTDPVGLLDSISQQLSGTGATTITDPVGVADSISQAATFAQTVTDPVGLTDSQARDLGRPVTDPVGLLDAAAQVLAAARTATDPVGLVDSRTQQSGTTGTLNHIITGDVTTSGFKVATRTTAAASVRLKVSTTSDLLTSPVFSSSATPDSDGYAKLTISGLAAGTQYFYGVEVDGTVAGTPQGACKTQVSGRGNFSFAFGSCHEETGLTADSAIYARAKARNPDLFISNGDFGYWDITTNSPATFRTDWNTLAAFTNVRSVLEDLPFYYTWSDHDFGPNNAVASSASNPAANLVYRQIFPSPTLEQATTGIYHAFTYRGARFIVTDERSFKSLQTDTDNSSKTVLGTTQKQWFKDQITAATEPLIFWVGDIPWIGAANTGDDEYDNYNTERQELGAHILASGKRVIRLAGDMHALAADDGTHSPGRMPVFHAAPFHNVFSNKGGPYTVGPFPTSGASNIDQYGFVQVADNGSGIDVTFTGYDTTDTAQVTLTVHDRTVTDAVGVADSRTQTSGGTAFAQTVTDGVGVSDVGQASDVATSLTDPVGLSDSRTQQAVVARSQTDPVGLLDSQTQQVSGAGTATVTDPVGILDSTSRVSSTSLTVTDSIGLLDSQTQQVSGATSTTLTDPLGVADSQSQQAALVRSLTDTVGLADSQTQQVSAATTQTITDTVGVADSQLSQRDAIQTITDPVGVADSQSQQFSGVTSYTITDQIGVADTVTRDLGRPVTDPVGLVDSQARDLGRPLADSVGIADTAAQLLAAAQAVTDPVGLADSRTQQVTGPSDRTITDPVGITDTVSYLVVDVTPRWVEGATTASGFVEGASVAVGIVEGSSSL